MWAAMTGVALRLVRTIPMASLPNRACSSSSVQEKLMAFFDDENTWNKQEQKVGRAWNTDELRIKSNTDLHKLWYVLLKERNMLLTMEEAAMKAWQPFQNPERIDKVDISMRNVETVVKERNTAYHMLETGEDGLRPMKKLRNQIGMTVRYRMSEHLIPRLMNKYWRSTRVFGYGGNAVKKFLVLRREANFIKMRQARNRNRNHVQRLFRYFPNLDTDVLARQYPDVDILHQKQSDKSRGHYIPKEYKD